MCGGLPEPFPFPELLLFGPGVDVPEHSLEAGLDELWDTGPGGTVPVGVVLLLADVLIMIGDVRPVGVVELVVKSCGELSPFGPSGMFGR